MPTLSAITISIFLKQQHYNSSQWCSQDLKEGDAKTFAAYAKFLATPLKLNAFLKVAG